MSKKGKNKKNNAEKKINLKPVLIVAIAVVVLAVAAFGIVKGVTSVKAKTLDVAFYDLPESIINPLQEKISAEYAEKINFTVLSADQYSAETISKKYDMFITWNGSAVTQLSDKAKKIPGSAYSYIVPSEIPESLDYLPVLLDHWEMAYYSRAMKNTVTGYPRSLENLTALLKEMKDIVFVPMYCSGGNDNELLALISVYTESIGGNAAYKKLVAQVKKAEQLSDVLDVELDSASKITLRSILDTIKEWQNDDLLYSKWIYSKDGELINLGNERQMGVFFTSLSKHRTLPQSLVTSYAADRFPLVDNKIKHGLIGNSVVCMKLSKTDRFDSIYETLVQPEFQYKLSCDTKLGPVGLTAQSYDRQADDVRYLTAVSSEGNLPDLSKAAFQTNPQKKSDFASQLRIYLKKNL